VSPLAAWLAGLGLMALLMTALWLVQRARRDAGVVDAGWALGLGLLALGYAAVLGGVPQREALVAGCMALWSFRLGGYLLRDRILGHREEDGRYQALRRAWGARQQPYLFAFFQAQGLVDALLSIPVLVLMRNPAPALSAWEWAGAAVVVASVAGETIADAQLAAWRREPANRGRTCRRGLWAWSRHPNYFFEWLHWWGYVLMGVGAPFGAVTLLGPALMTWFLLKVTGIPATEARALETRPDYRDYQRTVSPFVPWPPRRSA
jgi:steroid 5-alpha reductase family enzyme